MNVVSVNGVQTEIAEQTSLRRLVESMNICSDRGIAIAVNGAVVARHRWREIDLEAGDTIEIIRASQGG